MKKIPMLLLVFCPYLYLATVILICAMESGLSNDILCTNMYLFIGLVCAIYLPNAVYAFLLPKLGYQSRQILFWNMLLKLMHIPIYLVIFLFGTLMLLMIVGIMMIPFLVIFDYLLLLASSIYGISGAAAAVKEGKLKKSSAVVFCLLQFFFTLDVISAICLYVSVRNREKA